MSLRVLLRLTKVLCQQLWEQSARLEHPPLSRAHIHSSTHTLIHSYSTHTHTHTHTHTLTHTHSYRSVHTLLHTLTVRNAHRYIFIYYMSSEEYCPVRSEE